MGEENWKFVYLNSKVDFDNLSLLKFLGIFLCRGKVSTNASRGNANWKSYTLANLFIIVQLLDLFVDPLVSPLAKFINVSIFLTLPYDLF